MVFSFFNFIGQHADKALPFGLLVGFLSPLAASFFFELLFFTMAIPLALSLARIDWGRQLAYLKRWHLVLGLLIWMMVISPIIVWSIGQMLPLHEKLEIAMILTATAPPVTACAALALILRIDAALATVMTFLAMAVTPFIMPIMAFWLAGFELRIDFLDFVGRLALFVIVSFVGAFILKKVFGNEKTIQNAHLIDGISVICIGLSIVGLMHGAQALLLDQPLYGFYAFVYASLFVILLNFLASFIFWRLGTREAFAVGLISGHCNMGLVFMLLGKSADPQILIFFALGQIPMYVSPILFRKIYRRFFNVTYV